MGKRKLTSTNTLNRDYLKNECGTMYAITLLSGRWKMTILHKLSLKEMRFTELKENIPNISDRMLSFHLKEMEKDRLISKRVFAQVPPKVIYSLTTSALQLVPIWEKLNIWGNDQREIIENNF